MAGVLGAGNWKLNRGVGAYMLDKISTIEPNFQAL